MTIPHPLSTNREKAQGSFWAPKEQRFPAVVVKGNNVLAVLKLLITFK